MCLPDLVFFMYTLYIFVHNSVGAGKFTHVEFQSCHTKIYLTTHNKFFGVSLRNHFFLVSYEIITLNNTLLS